MLHATMRNTVVGHVERTDNMLEAVVKLFYQNKQFLVLKLLNT